MRLFVYSILVLGACAVVTGEEIRFNRDIRPILSNNCFYCHGPDEKTQEADLRLDSFEAATRDLGGYAAIVPGKPDESELIFRIEDHEDPMPPKKSKKVVTKEQLALLRKWIEQGAEYESHWSFMPVEKRDPPEVKNASWSKNEIDRFILARLEAKGIKPSPEADRAILIRRLSIDLLGLLPDPKRVEAFVKDASPDAYEKLVDEMLASPHYGERWGRHWLDQARYADSNGYSVDGERQMWPFRDWVIHALNEDKPFDQFTIEQIAGDLLENPTKSQLVATAFHRNTLINQEGGTDPEQFRVEAAFDRVNTTGAVWLGLTLSCAQCHTHKFDPIQHRDYFEMYAFFNSGSDRNNSGKVISVSKGEMFGRSVEVEQPNRLPPEERAKLKKEWEAKEKLRLSKVFEQSGKPTRWAPINVTEASTSSGVALKETEFKSWLIQPGYKPKDSIRVTAKVEAGKVAAIRLRVLPDPSLPKNGPGSAGNGNFVLTRFDVSVRGKPVAMASAFADHEQPGYGISGTIDQNPRSGWAINIGKGQKNVKMNAPHEAVFLLSEAIDLNGNEPLEFTLHHELNDNYLVGNFAIDVTADSPALPASKQAELEKFSAILDKPEDKRSKAERDMVEAKFVAAVPEARVEKPKADPKLEGRVMVMEDLVKRRPTYILTRGDFTRPDKESGELHPGGLASVAPALPAQEGRNRLDLAKWLVDAQNPLTPRVTMNRVWMRYFGRGLVETEEDFGTQGTLPSHPGLLDWLAAEFVGSGWSMKEMHRHIVTSATYRQSSKTRADLQEIDARNLLLGRQSRIRFDAEIVRDAALDASGLLTREIGGPSVHPPQPAGVYAFTQTGKRWNTETGENRYRRAMYTKFFRSAPYPLFTTFDAPDFSSVCTRRVKSNTPLQALNVANDPVFIEFAQALALRLAKEVPGNLRQQVEHGFQLCVSRSPSEQEIEVLRTYLGKQLEAAKTDPDLAARLTTEPLRQAAGSSENAVALVSLARVLFNTDNFITRE